jgi:hypothetical protein
MKSDISFATKKRTFSLANDTTESAVTRSRNRPKHRNAEPKDHQPNILANNLQLWRWRMVGSFLGRLCLCVSVVSFCLSTSSAQQAGGSSIISDQKLSGLAVIVKVESVAGDPLFHADGYRIRVDSGTVTDFSGALKALPDVVPNTWIRFEGVRDDTGVLVARKAAFFPAGSHKVFRAMGPKKAKQVPDYQPVTQESLLDASGRFVSLRTKVRYSDSGGPCGWHRVPADQTLQERVERIGTSIVPAYQKHLQPDSPYRIPFRFYAVADDKVRSVFACNDGLVLVPKNVVERLPKDDQLAAVLADGVAFNLKKQLVTISPFALAPNGAPDALAFIPAALFPAEYVAGNAIKEVVDHELEARLQKDFACIALQLIADAGYDPWQAPEAWRLLAPADPPADIRSLNYPREAEYQLRILKLQYKPAKSAEGSASATVHE